MNKTHPIKEAIEKALKRESKLTTEALEVPSMTSLNIRHLLNNLGAISENYLECGSHLGGHFCSVIFGNNNLKSAVAIDNYSEFDRSGTARKGFLDNVEMFAPKEKLFYWKLITEDCFTVKEISTRGSLNQKFDLYNYDAQHTESAQQMAVSHFLPNLTKEFIMVVDDWSFDGVESGTRNGIILSGLEVLFEQIFITPENEQPNEHWHNGYAIFYLKQIYI